MRIGEETKYGAKRKSKKKKPMVAQEKKINTFRLGIDKPLTEYQRALLSLRGGLKTKDVLEVGRRAGQVLKMAELGERDTLLFVDDSFQLIVYSVNTDQRLGSLPITSS